MSQHYSNLPVWLRTAIDEPSTWGFWDWVGYTAAVIAIIAFLRLAIITILNWLDAKFSRAVWWSITMQMKEISRSLASLAKELRAASSWRDRPSRLVAKTGRAFAGTFVISICGVTALITLLHPIDLALGLPLIGISVLRLNWLKSQLLIGMECDKYVAEQIERIDRKVEKLVLQSSDPEIEKFATDIRGFYGDLRKVAQDIDGIHTEEKRVEELVQYFQERNDNQ